MCSPTPKLGRTLTVAQLGVGEERYQWKINGYNIMKISVQDAQARGINYGDIVKIFNHRGLLCAALVTAL